MGADKRKDSEIIGRWGPALVWAGIIFLLSSISTLPGAAVPIWDFLLKKATHMFMFGVLFFFVQRGVNWDKKTRNWWLPMLITLMYAASDEYHQSFVFGRTAMLSDVGYDVIGAAMTYLRINQLI